MRPSKSRDEFYMQQALLIATRSTCFRRECGCVLTNHRGHVLSTGYNGRPSGMPHCNEMVYQQAQNIDMKVPVYPHQCKGANLPSGTGLDACEAVHAEQNALLQCRDVWDIETCYTTASPCIHCVKLLMNTSCRRIVFHQEYPHQEARTLWLSIAKENNREWIHLGK